MSAPKVLQRDSIETTLLSIDLVRGIENFPWQGFGLEVGKNMEINCIGVVIHELVFLKKSILGHEIYFSGLRRFLE